MPYGNVRTVATSPYVPHKQSDAARFGNMLESVAGKRLMYQHLLGNDCAPTAAMA